MHEGWCETQAGFYMDDFYFGCAKILVLSTEGSCLGSLQLHNLRQGVAALVLAYAVPSEGLSIVRNSQPLPPKLVKNQYIEYLALISWFPYKPLVIPALTGSSLFISCNRFCVLCSRSSKAPYAKMSHMLRVQ